MKPYKIPTARLMVLSFILLALLNLNLYAQHFEGALAIQTIDDKKKIDEVVLFVKQDRLRFVGSIPGANTLVPVTGESLLLRADQKDMVLFGEDDTALKINFQELETLLNMFSVSVPGVSDSDEGNGTSKNQSTTVVTETGETRRIQGYLANKMLITDKEKPESEIHVWLTDELKIDWIRMLDTFGSLRELFGIDSINRNYGIDFSKTPLLIQIFENKNLTSTVQISHIDERKLTRDEIDIPERYKLMTFFQMMMQQNRR
jgi:hypothetical protein